MAETEGKSSISVPWAPLLAVLAAVAGLTALLPSRSARPPAPSDMMASNGESGVSARLWQDPLSVAREAAMRLAGKPAAASTPDAVLKIGELTLALGPGKPAAEQTPGFRELREMYQELAKKADGRPPTVLVVCVPNTPYAEDVERRVRDRAGVIHALAEEGYLPEDSAALHYVMVEGRTEEILPYEGFHSLDPHKQNEAVLVLWLADGVLDSKRAPGRPLLKLGLLHQLAEIVRNLAAETLPNLRVLGPSSSEEYRRMLEGERYDNPECPLANLAAVQIYSCMAGAPEETLAAGIHWLDIGPAAGKLTDKELETRTETALTERLQKLGARNFQLTRTIRSDDAITAALWKELRARGVAADAPVAAIAELDSFYGHATMDSFLRSCRAAQIDQDIVEGVPRQPVRLTDKRQEQRALKDLKVVTFKQKEQTTSLRNVYQFTYMAGLDGALPKNALGTEEQKTKDTDSDAKSSASTDDPTEGLSQVDYLRRLADQLVEKNRQLNAAGKELSAVVMLGSDIYDKLQILRTLRPRLPNALFLTNYLDARFGHPDEWPETRNLLVASNYDLKTGRYVDWGSAAPPFRDSLQTAVYAAARIALEELPPENKYRGRAEVYEIGRAGAVLLTEQPPLPYDAWAAIGCLYCLGVLAWVLWSDQLKSQEPPAITVAAGFPYPSSAFPRAVVPASSFRRSLLHESRLAVPLIVVLGFVGTVLRYELQGQKREPFAFLDGDSIWPGDFLRLCALLLAIHFALKMLYDLHKNLDQLEGEFAIVHPSDRPLPETEGSGWKRFRRNFWPQNENYVSHGLVDVRRLWLRYKTWAMGWKRLARTALLLGVYSVALTLFLSAVSEPLPHLPTRGSARVSSYVLMYCAGTAALFVTILVFDATVLNGRSIRALNQGRTQWHLDQVYCRSEKFAFPHQWRLLDREDCADYLDIELIARRSDVINDLVYYPITLWTLILAARWEMTDNYQWPPALLIALGANLAWMLYCAIRLPFEANAARRKSLERLRAKLFVRRIKESRAGEANKDKLPEKSSVSALEQVIAQIENLNRGAFVGIWDQPVLRALLLPSGGAGIWALLQLLPH